LAECDDGNTRPGDGCSALCTIEDGYACRPFQGQSYCWSTALALHWDIFNAIGSNTLLLEISSEVDLSHTIISIHCSFNCSLLENTQGPIHTFTIEYRESTLLKGALENSTFRYVAGVNSTNRCNLSVDGVANYTITVNTVPESLLVGYQEDIQSFVSGATMRRVLLAMLMAILGVAVVGVTPGSSFAALRVNLLMMVSYLDYYGMPINSFSIYQAL
jgi:hypothetical protein